MERINGFPTRQAIREFVSPWWQFPISMMLWAVPMLLWIWHYLGFGLNQILSLMLFPFALQLKEAGSYSGRHAWGVFICLACGYFFENGLPLFLAGGFCLIFLLEYYVGKLSYLPMVLVVLMSPFIASWFTAFTFPIQLFQTQQLGELLGLMGREVTVYGNRFLMEGSWFDVDTACLGIHILNLALFITVLILSLFENRLKFSLLEVCGWLVLAGLLAFLANFVRMTVLVWFQSPPGTLGHELAGLLAIAFCVGAPLYLLIWLRSHQKGPAPPIPWSVRPLKGGIQSLFPHLVAGVFLLFVLLNVIPMNHALESKTPTLYYQGFSCKKITRNISQLTSDSTLIYIKAPSSPWRADHHPTICWKGSGHAVRNIHLDSLDGKEVFRALLIKDVDTLHTAWWYSNGFHHTSHQLEWRKRSLQGDEGYYLFNLSSITAVGLEQECHKLLTTSFEDLGLVSH